VLTHGWMARTTRSCLPGRLAASLLLAVLLSSFTAPVPADTTFWLDFSDFDASMYGLGGQEDLLVQSIYGAVVNDATMGTRTDTYSVWPMTLTGAI